MASCGAVFQSVRTPVRSLMGRHDELVERAIHVAKTSEHAKWQLGAVLTRNSRTLSSAPNRFRNNPWISHLHATYHAEQAALRKGLLNSARGTTMYVARVARDGTTRMARPCARCMKAMYEAGVREVVYTTDDGSYKIERVVDLPTNSSDSGVDTAAGEHVL